jgi:NADH dehydrogenase
MPVASFTVLGGTGFLGRRVVARLLARGFCVRSVSRHPERVHDSPNLAQVYANIHDENSLAVVLEGTQAAVNAVSLYAEHGRETFHTVHVIGAARAARMARRAGVAHFVHMSGIGAAPSSRSLYIAKRGEGETAVRSVLPNAVIVRSAVMFGPDDAFLNRIVGLLRALPIYPMFGRGDTRLQPAFVEDVGEAVARMLERGDAHNGSTYELGGPRIYTYRELLQTIADRLGKQPVLLPVPFAVWRALARLVEILPKPPLARNQVELMQIDTVAAPSPGFDALNMAPQDIHATLDEIVSGSVARRAQGPN